MKGAAFRYAGAPAEVGGLSLTANFRPDTLVVPDLRATVAGQPVTTLAHLYTVAGACSTSPAARTRAPLPMGRLVMYV